MNGKSPSYHGYRFPPEIIRHAVWLYHRFCMSFGDVEDLLAQRGITVPYEAIRLWCNKFGPEYARGLKRRQGRLGDTWHLDRHHPGTAAISLACGRSRRRRNRHSRAVASRPPGSQTLFSHAVEGARSRARPAGDGQAEKLRRWTAHGEVMPSVIHSTDQYENNRAEVSHEPTRQRERQMRKFKSPGQAQRFLSVHGLVQNLFRVGRHLLQARHHRELRGRAFLAWDAVTCAA